MKKVLMAVSLFSLMLFMGNQAVTGQDEPKPKKDTVNMDTYAKPETYYALEDDEAADSDRSNVGLIAIIAAAVIVVAGAGMILLRKKK